MNISYIYIYICIYIYMFLSSFSGGLLQCLGCLSTVTSFKQIEAQETGSGSETFSEYKITTPKHARRTNRIRENAQTWCHVCSGNNNKLLGCAPCAALWHMSLEDF